MSCPICLMESYEEPLLQFEKNKDDFLFLRDFPFDVVLLEK